MTRRPVPFEIGPVHFIGIGGIGMSGIAEVMATLGYKVQGSDLADNYNVARLRKAGIAVEIVCAGGPQRDRDVGGAKQRRWTDLEDDRAIGVGYGCSSVGEGLAEVAEVDEDLRPDALGAVARVGRERRERDPGLLDETPRRNAAQREIRLQVGELARMPQRATACQQQVDHELDLSRTSEHPDLPLTWKRDATRSVGLCLDPKGSCCDQRWPVRVCPDDGGELLDLGKDLRR